MKDNTNGSTHSNHPSKTFISFSNPIYTKTKDAALISFWLYDYNGLIVARSLMVKLENARWIIQKVLSEKE